MTITFNPDPVSTTVALHDHFAVDIAPYHNRLGCVVTVGNNRILIFILTGDDPDGTNYDPD